MTFKYDPFGRRIEKISPTTTSIFVYDGDSLIETTNGSGSEVAAYTPTQNIDESLAMDRNGTIDYYEQDGLGSVTSLTSSSGSVAQTYTYDSFGTTTTSSGSLTNFFRYTGREFDAETGLFYYRARYYDPAGGRFLSNDPENFAADVNFYRYVGDDPVGLTDPSGLCPADNPCKVPPHPGNADIDVNITAAMEAGRTFQFLMVLPHAPWDYKNTDGSQYDDFGNFNFGATGAALGYSDTELLAGAGALKALERAWKGQHTPRADTLGQYGNERHKDDMIKAGIRYFKAGCATLFKVPL